MLDSKFISQLIFICEVCGAAISKTDEVYFALDIYAPMKCDEAVVKRVMES